MALHLFDLNPAEESRVRRFLLWHFFYMVLVAIFFSFLYFTGRYRSNPFLTERFLFIVAAPLSTMFFVMLSPWRHHWALSIRDMYRRLEGQTIFCCMGGFVFVFGFFIYSIFLWGLGALGPSLVYM